MNKENNNQKPEKDLTQEVMSKIHSRHLKMRPKFYFLLGSFLVALGFLASFFVAVFFVNLAFFRLRLHEPFDYLWFGKFGFKPFLATFPWLWLLMAVFGIGLGIYFIKKYDISYKINFWGLSLVLILVVFSFGFFIDILGINERMIPYGCEHSRPLYPLYHEKFHDKDWIIGQVTEVRSNTTSMEIMTPAGEIMEISWSKETLLPFGSDFSTGTKVRIVGSEENGKMKAKAIGAKDILNQKLEKESDLKKNIIINPCFCPNQKP